MIQPVAVAPLRDHHPPNVSCQGELLASQIIVTKVSSQFGATSQCRAEAQLGRPALGVQPVDQRPGWLRRDCINHTKLKNVRQGNAVEHVHFMPGCCRKPILRLEDSVLMIVGKDPQEDHLLN